MVSSAEHDAVLAFYDKLAFRALVLVHQGVAAQDLGLIRRIVELESPAHVEVQVDTATWPLLVGIASLVGVDTYLGPPRQRPARAGVSSLAMATMCSAGQPRPAPVGATAPVPSPARRAAGGDAGPDMSVAQGRSFVLDGSGSSAAPGGRITEYRWRLTE